MSDSPGWRFCSVVVSHETCSFQLLYMNMKHVVGVLGSVLMFQITIRTNLWDHRSQWWDVIGPQFRPGPYKLCRFQQASVTSSTESRWDMSALDPDSPEDEPLSSSPCSESSPWGPTTFSAPLEILEIIRLFSFHSSSSYCLIGWIL